MGSVMPARLKEHWKTPHGEQPGRVRTLFQASVVMPRSAVPKAPRAPRETTEHTPGRIAEPM